MAAPKKNKKFKGDLDFENDDDVISTDNFADDSSETVEEEEAEDTQELNFDADYGRMSDLSDDSDDWN